MRIAILTRSYDHQIGGMEIHTQVLAKGLADSGHAVTVICPDAPGIVGTGHQNIDILRVSKRPNSFLKYSIGFWLGVRKECIKGRYDLIINVSMAAVGLLVPSAKHWSPVVTVFHGTYVSDRQTIIRSLRKKITAKYIMAIPYTYIFQLLQNQLFKESSAVIAVSDNVAEVLSKRHNNLKINTIKNFIDTDLFETRKRSYSRKIRVLYFGRLHREKGIENLLSAIQLMETNSTIKNFRFNIYGDGELNDAVSSIASEFDSVTYGGPKKHEELPEILKSNDVFIFPTLSNEGLPLSLLESMAAGLIVLSSRVAGTEKVIQNGVNGFFLTDPTPKKIAEKLEQVRKMSGEMSNISKNARETIVKNYSLNTQMKKVLAVINQFDEINKNVQG